MALTRCIDNLLEPTKLGTYSVLLDSADLNIDLLASFIGLYVYVLACHKGANYRLMNRSEDKQVLYLRDYDLAGSLYVGGNMAMGFSSGILHELTGNSLSCLRLASTSSKCLVQGISPPRQ